jgi:glycosyltransferase involved in cell wall biosynthesis
MTTQAPTGPSIAVVTICMNNKHALLATADSVLGQSYPGVEYVIVDGASEDGTAQAALHLRARCATHTIRVASERDRGISDAMNKGVSLSGSDLILHLNAGDTLADPSVLKEVADSYRQHRWRWAVGEAAVVGTDGVTSHRYRPDPRIKTLLRKNTIPHQATFLHRSVFEEFGGFRSDLHQGMDYEYWCRIGLIGGIEIHPLGRLIARYEPGGRSSELRTLLPSLWRIRRDLGNNGAGNSLLNDVIFVARIGCFGLYLRTKQLLLMIPPVHRRYKA